MKSHSVNIASCTIYIIQLINFNQIDYMGDSPGDVSENLCSFSKFSITSPTSQLFLQPFRRFTYVTSHSPTLQLLHLCHSSFSSPSFASLTSQVFTYITWRAAHDRLFKKYCWLINVITEIYWLIVNVNQWNTTALINLYFQLTESQFRCPLLAVRPEAVGVLRTLPIPEPPMCPPRTSTSPFFLQNSDPEKYLKLG